MKKRRLSNAQFTNLSFLTTILIGSILLMLPISTKSGQSTSFVDALFTATSATCVTGLVVRDTATYWSSLGQTIIITLIQIGGLGTITVVILYNLISGKQIGLKQRSMMQDSISAPQIGGIIQYTKFIVKTAFLIEGIGALLLFIVFGKQFGLVRGFLYSIFHSISAFCNAGFDLMGNYSSLTSFVSNPLINVVVCLLIIVGGIGFITWEDIKEHKHHIRKYRLQSKVVLTTSLVLTVLPMIYFFIFEFGSYPLGQRFLMSLFQAVTPRTAGFNTADYSSMSQSGIAITIMLMLVGGSPGSTAGGIKTVTIAILFCTMITTLKGEEHTHFHKRRISDKIVRSAFTVACLYVIMAVVSAILISNIEGLPLLTCLFETGSAIATVGLSMSVTPTLSVISKIILIILMYTGRVGGMTLAYSLLINNRSNTSRLPEDKVFIG